MEAKYKNKIPTEYLNMAGKNSAEEPLALTQTSILVFFEMRYPVRLSGLNNEENHFSSAVLFQCLVFVHDEARSGPCFVHDISSRYVLKDLWMLSNTSRLLCKSLSRSSTLNIFQFVLSLIQAVLSRVLAIRCNNLRSVEIELHNAGQFIAVIATKLTMFYIHSSPPLGFLKGLFHFSLTRPRSCQKVIAFLRTHRHK